MGEELPLRFFGVGPGIREIRVRGESSGKVDVETPGEIFGWGSEDAGPAVGDDGDEGAEEHDVLHAGLEFSGAGGAVEDGMGGAGGDLQGFDCVGVYGEGGEGRERG
jgi:hypothetical protein